MKFSPLTIAAFSLLLLSSISPIFAVDQPTTITPGKRSEINQIKKEVKTETKQTRTDLKTKIAQARLDAQRKITLMSQTGIYNSFTKRAETQKKYQDLIQKRLTDKSAKIEVDKLAMARTSLGSTTLWAKYNTDLSTFKTTFASLSIATDPKSVVPTLKTQAKLVNQDLNSIHTALVNTLRLVVKAK